MASDPGRRETPDPRGGETARMGKERTAIRNLAIGLLAGTVVLFAGLFILNASLKRKVEYRRQYLAELSARLSDLETQSDHLGVEDVIRLADAFNNRIFWTQKLEALSRDSEGLVTVRKINYSNGVLTLAGISEMDGVGGEEELVEAIVENLRSDPQINNDFPLIRSGLSKRQKAGPMEILEFLIECHSRDSAALGGLGTRP